MVITAPNISSNRPVAPLSTQQLLRHQVHHLEALHWC